METLRYTNSTGLTLVADYYAVPDAKAVVVLAHGMSSDRQSRGRFIQIAEALNASGFSAFAFDFAGCGESADTLITPKSLLQDLHDTLKYAQGFAKPLAIWGHSLGSITSLRGWLPDVHTMVLTGVGAGPLTYDWNTLLSSEQLESWHEKGEVLYPSSSSCRPYILLSSAVLENFSNFGARAILGRIQTPVLMVNGDDDEERLLSDTVVQGMKYLPSGSRHIIIPGMGHSLTGYMDEVIQLGLEWLNQRLSLPQD
jgi:pimeloyl-ACP methyl ester carboxylesterase